MGADHDGGRFIDPPPLALAHRGGVKLPVNSGIENSVRAVRNAVDLGFSYIETDVRPSSDGVAFAFHDPDLTRVCSHTANAGSMFSSLTAKQIKELPLDGGEPIATLAELLQACPHTRFNIDVKTAAVIAPTVRAIAAAGAQERVLIASFSMRRLRTARRMLPGVATSANPLEVLGLVVGWGPLRALARRHGAVAVQVPEYYRGFRLVSPRFVRIAHEEGLQVHVWTVDEPSDMNRLLDMGVDGIITDRPDILKDVLIERGQWRDSQGEIVGDSHQ
ncbi:MAG: glycerophosphodiester phosphodiesterase family protein [Beutenbergiaceae bacterium]